MFHVTDTTSVNNTTIVWTEKSDFCIFNGRSMLENPSTWPKMDELLLQTLRTVAADVHILKEAIDMLRSSNDYVAHLFVFYIYMNVGRYLYEPKFMNLVIQLGKTVRETLIS